MRFFVERLLGAGASKFAELKARSRLRSHGVTLSMEPGGWSIGYDDAAAIATELERLVQRGAVNVLEVGCGFSTIVLLALLDAKFGRSFELVSLETDQAWHDQIAQKVRTSYPTIADAFSLLKVEYVARDGDRTIDLDRIWSQLPFDLCDVILVDAPPDTHGEDVRLKLCLELVQRLNPKGMLLLHDTNRIHELFAYAQLSCHFHMAERLETEKGLSVFRFPRQPA